MNPQSVEAWRLYWVEVQSFTDVAKTLGIPLSRLRKLWAHWGFPKRRQGPLRAPKKLTEADILDILRRVLEDHESQAHVARAYEVSRQRIGQVVRDERHRLQDG